jgi:antitoxin Phd
MKGVEHMNINVDNLVSISEANQNFLRIARLVDEKGTAIILKNNAPRYVLLDYSLFRQNTVADDADVDAAAIRILDKHLKAFEELAK